MARSGYDEVVLLTGFPSFLARRIAWEMLAASGPLVLLHLLVAEEQLPLVESWAQQLPGDARQRLSLLDGDPSRMDLGLSGPEFLALAREVDVIHHAASLHYRGGEREEAERRNLTSTGEVLEFARACTSLRRLVHYSSVRVSGDREGTVLEDDLDKGQSFSDVVGETLARAEKMLRDTAGAVPLSIVRAGLLLGDAESGEVDPEESLTWWMSLVLGSPTEIALPLPLRSGGSFPVATVDDVARVGLAAGRDALAQGKTFHVLDKTAPQARDAFERVAVAGGRRIAKGSIPPFVANALLRAPGLSKVSAASRSCVESLRLRVDYDTTQADALRAKAALTPRPFDDYIDGILRRLQERMKDRRTPQKTQDVHDPLV